MALIHMTEIDETIASFTTNAENYQQGIAGDDNSYGYRPLIYKSNLAGVLETLAIGENALLADLDISGNLDVEQYIRRRGGTDDYIDFQNDKIDFYTNNVLGFTLNDDIAIMHNVLGIGNTPNANWNSNTIDWGGGAITAINLNELLLSTNLYYDGAWKTITADASTLIEVDKGTFILELYNTTTIDTTPTNPTRVSWNPLNFTWNTGSSNVDFTWNTSIGQSLKIEGSDGSVQINNLSSSYTGVVVASSAGLLSKLDSSVSLTSISTGAGDNDALVTQGYVDDSADTHWTRSGTHTYLTNTGDSLAIGTALQLGKVFIYDASGVQLVLKGASASDQKISFYEAFGAENYGFNITLDGSENTLNIESDLNGTIDTKMKFYRDNNNVDCLGNFNTYSMDILDNSSPLVYFRDLTAGTIKSGVGYNVSSDKLILSVGSSGLFADEKLSIDINGNADFANNIGMNVTPNSNFTKKAIDWGSGNLWGDTTQMNMSENLYYDGAYKTYATGESSYINLTAGTCQIRCYDTAVAGTTPTSPNYFELNPIATNINSTQKAVNTTIYGNSYTTAYFKSDGNIGGGTTTPLSNVGSAANNFSSSYKGLHIYNSSISALVLEGTGSPPNGAGNPGNGIYLVDRAGSTNNKILGMEYWSDGTYRIVKYNSDNFDISAATDLLKIGSTIAYLDVNLDVTGTIDASSTITGSAIISESYLQMDEIAALTPTSGQGYLFTKSDNVLYFTSGDTTERKVTTNTYADIHVHDASTSQTIATGASYTKVTLFTDNGLSANCTANVASDKITITEPGVYEVHWNVSFSSATANVVFQAAAFLNGVEQNQIHGERKVSSSGDVGNMTALGRMTVSSTPVDLDARIKHDNGSNVDITISYSCLMVRKVG